MHLAFRDVSSAAPTTRPLITIKNRLCCPNDQSPLFSVLEKKLNSYQYEVVCNNCGTKYMEEKVL